MEHCCITLVWHLEREHSSNLGRAGINAELMIADAATSKPGNELNIILFYCVFKLFISSHNTHHISVLTLILYTCLSPVELDDQT